MYYLIIHSHTPDIVVISQSDFHPNVTFTNAPARLKKELDIVLVL